MANTFLTPSIIAKEAMMQLRANCVMAGLVHRDYSGEFVKGVGDTVTIRKPATFEAKEFDRASGIQIQDATEGSDTIKLDKLLDVSFEVTSEQLTMDIADFSVQLLQPAMQSFAQKIDLYLLGLYKDIPASSGTAGTTPSTIAAITDARQVLGESLVPLPNRRLVIDPAVENSFLQLSTFHEADKLGDNGTAMREASLGRKFGFDIYTDQNVLTHTKGTLAVGGGTSPKIHPKAAGDVGATTLTLNVSGGTSPTLTGTLKAGDSITIGSNTYLVTKDATAASNEIAVEFTPGLKAAVVTTDEVTVGNSYVANLAFHRNAFALVTRPLALPNGISGEQKAIVNYDGFGLRVIYDYNSQYKKDVISIDMLCGVKTLDSRLACRLLG
ncbi:P22 phage major capsid protein family protein [Pygmaiobacter massiliensis]|uniref:P22 phage major capsid protein family protein n=1 Tax=Pygmaiobacter massiliensis TaxID=1917873 RepID=UPI002A811CF4|nr:P22 phage major capsid protein family protein [Pygmaiobacter massiliensis]MDY4785119.1 P22 phage major capsid protein family protein [Pygmaiobacter massiliensis]